MESRLYLYEGPVMKFETCIVNKWRAYSYAANEGEARSNLAYRFKKQNNLLPGARITLPGKFTVLGEEENYG